MRPPSHATRLLHTLLGEARAAGQPAEAQLAQLAARRLLLVLAAADAPDMALKGATMLAGLLPGVPRHTHNLDLLLRAPQDDDGLRACIAALAAGAAAEDGPSLLPAHMDVAPVALGPGYGARAVQLPVALAGLTATLRLHVCPPEAPRPRRLPLALAGTAALPAVTVLAQTAEACLAEKVEALVRADGRGLPTTRWQDLWDIDALAQGRTFVGSAVLAALREVFGQRLTRVPEALPAVFGGRASVAPLRRAGFAAWQRGAAPGQRRTLAQVVAMVGDLVELPLARLAARRGLAGDWPPGGPWQLRRG